MLLRFSEMKMGTPVPDEGAPGKSLPLPWYALKTRSRQEKTAARSLESRGYEVFLPLFKCRRRWSDRINEIELPLFSTYLFCRFDAQYPLPILMAPGVAHIVCSGTTPKNVDHDEIRAVRQIVKSGFRVQPWPFLRLGQAVCLESGPLSGLEGILVDLKSTRRLVVSITLLQRSVAVEVDQEWVRPSVLASGRRSGGLVSSDIAEPQYA